MGEPWPGSGGEGERNQRHNARLDTGSLYNFSKFLAICKWGEKKSVLINFISCKMGPRAKPGYR